MHEHHLSVPRTARYFTLGPANGARDVWFVCHGYGQLAARFLERFRVLDTGERQIVAPEGLSRFYLSESPLERRVGASWMTSEDRMREIGDYVAYLDAVYKAVGPVRARVTVLGFSQGCATATRWVAMGTARVDRLIVWGGDVPPDLELRGQHAERLHAVRPTLVYGTRDQYFTPKIVAATESRLRDHDVAYDLVSFDGGHEIHEETLRTLSH